MYINAGIILTKNNVAYFHYKKGNDRPGLMKIR